VSEQPNIRRTGIVDVDFGPNVTVVEPVNLYGCSIGEGSFIGPFVEIQKGVCVGRFCRIQSHAFVCELVEIGDHTVISHGVMFINDPYKSGGPAQGDRKLWKGTSVGSHVSIGTNATILPVRIADRTVIGAGSVVTHDISEAGIYAGNPARKLRSL
jgi:acetyltransferase-like isoleucine patch superfamily enzyme